MLRSRRKSPSRQIVSQVGLAIMVPALQWALGTERWNDHRKDRARKVSFDSAAVYAAARLQSLAAAPGCGQGPGKVAT